jgi:hypothetical protein
MLQSELKEAIDLIESGRPYKLSRHRFRQINDVLKYVYKNWDKLWSEINKDA